MIKIPKISIVTPSLNQGKFLEQTIVSILSQNYPNLEYVIMDGGSSDESSKIIRKYSGRLKFWQSEKDEGQWDAINKGFAKTTGEIMTWLNSDDILMPGTLNLVANIFGQLPDTEWLTGRPTTINQEGFNMHIGFKPAYINKLIKLGFYHGACLGFIMQEGTFWRRRLWDKSGGKVERVNLSIDYKLWKNFAKYAELTPVLTSLAAFRLNPHRKTKELGTYFKEIGVPFPKLLRIIFFPIRLFVHFVIRKIGASSQIFYDKEKNRWRYLPGWLSVSKRFTKSKWIKNEKL